MMLPHIVLRQGEDGILLYFDRTDYAEVFDSPLAHRIQDRIQPLARELLKIWLCRRSFSTHARAHTTHTQTPLLVVSVSLLADLCT